MPDQLRERFDALRNAVERTDAAGLRDVRARRTRRARTRVAAGTAVAVSAIALSGLVVLPQLGDEAPTSAGGAQVLDASAGSRGSAADEAANPTAAQGPPETIGPETTQSAPSDQTPRGPFSITADSLLTWPEIEAVGETGPGTMPYSATLVFPGLCGAENAYAEYSGPTAVAAAVWTLSDGRLSQSGIQYESDAKAGDALARLVQDTQNCPVVNEYASMQFVGTDLSVGSEVAFFDLIQESGQDGSIQTSRITVARIANVLVEVVLLPDGPSVSDVDNRSRALAEAAVNAIVTPK